MKARYLSRLRMDLERGLVDSDIAEWLLEVNSMQCLATTSSCSGRVALLYGPNMMSKRDARIMYTWHDPRECRAEACRPAPQGLYTWWLSLQPPIIHFLAEDPGVAEEIVTCGDKAGFSKLGYRRHRTGLIHVEAGAGDKVHLVLPAPCSEVLALCEILETYKARLRAFMDCIRGICP